MTYTILNGEYKETRYIPDHVRMTGGSGKQYKKYGTPGKAAKPFKVKAESGDILYFETQSEFAELLDVELSAISVAMSRGRKTPDKTMTISGVKYYILEGEQ